VRISARNNNFWFAHKAFLMQGKHAPASDGVNRLAKVDDTVVIVPIGKIGATANSDMGHRTAASPAAKAAVSHPAFVGASLRQQPPVSLWDSANIASQFSGGGNNSSSAEVARSRHGENNSSLGPYAVEEELPT
jgi:hypothetical protein